MRPTIGPEARIGLALTLPKLRPAQPSFASSSGGTAATKEYSTKM